jgi:O-antigen/teichoic acid export membrane protein
MAISVRILLKGTAWTVGAELLGNMIRLVTSIVLARLLAPELFGVMTIIYTLRNGIELVSDFGVSQNIISNKNAEDPEFYNTAWSLQLVRNIVLFFIFLAAVLPAAHFYNSPILLYIMPMASLTFVLSGLSSVSPSLLKKRMNFVKMETYYSIIAFTQAAAAVLAALVTPTVWALIFSYVFSSVVATVWSHFLVPDVKQKFYISRRYAFEIAHFGKWVFASSLAFFLATNFDRLYLAKIIPLEVVGVYAIARNISDLASSLFLRLGSSLLFPFISAHSHMPRQEFRAELAALRMKFLLVAAIGFAVAAAGADLVIKILYDQRYHAAGWMLPVLIMGAWFSILANLNEAALLGLGKPSYTAVSNSLKCAILMIGLPLAFARYGLLGAVTMIAFADVGRYIPALFGQIRESFSFGTQDALLTLFSFLLLAALEWCRSAIGFGTSFDALPIEFGRLIWAVP